MHRRPPKFVPPLILALILAAGWFATRGNKAFSVLSTSTLSGSGAIQADEYTVASEIPGRVIELNADEGDSVRAGQVLAKLDAALLTAQVEGAEAALALAEANLAKAQAGARPEEIRQAEAALAQAVAKRDGAKTALSDAQAMRNHPQDLEIRISAARSALDAAEHRALAANLVAQAASLERDYFQRTLADLENPFTVEIPTPLGIVRRTVSVRTDEIRAQLALASGKEWNAWTAARAAAVQRDGARADLANLLAVQADPLALNAQVDAARAQLDAAEAAVKVAQAKLDSLKAGTRQENIAAAQAQVAQAQAARDALKAQLNQMTLTAPGDGIVTRRFLDLGEMAVAGSAVFHLSNLNTVTLTIYLPEDQIGAVQVGAGAHVAVDSFPGRVFAGRVIFISPQAEFTPKNIATKEQRTTQVFAVKIRIENPDHALKPGMPADAAIQ